MIDDIDKVGELKASDLRKDTYDSLLSDSITQKSAAVPKNKIDGVRASITISVKEANVSQFG